jgi:hypothetical protein
LIEDFRMLVATPLRSLNIFLRHDSAARAMEPRAIDQTCLERLELFAGDDMVVSIDNHGSVLSMWNGFEPIRLLTQFVKPLSYSA